MAACCSLTVSAIPADPRPKQFRQPDGSVLTVLIRGDERAHITMTEDGVPLFYNKATATFEYARLSGNKLVGSGMTARNAAARTSDDNAYLSGIDAEAMRKAVFNTAKVSRVKGNTTRIRINDFPATGRPKSLVILWEFNDLSFTSVDDPKQFFTDMLNKEGFTYSNGATGSARDFYRASSAGLFDPDFVVVGPVRLSHDADYYGKNVGASIDVNVADAIVESCQALDDEIDFSEYDTDGDGYVDNIYFFYAGNGEADSPAGNDCIWPHSSYLEQGYGIELTLDGKKIDRYTCSNELRYEYDGSKIPAGIGTFVHEFGHVLGLADHYDTTYNMFVFDPGVWDTMASGSYNNNSNTPPLYSAFERDELGWIDLIDLNTDADSVSLLPNLGDSNKAFRVKVPGYDNEYFIMENRQQQGWDEYLPGHGMLVWHIDMDEMAWEYNMVNSDPQHQRVDIVEADGKANDATLSGDPFPGTANVTEYQLMSWNGDSIMGLADVVEQDDTIRLLIDDTKFMLTTPAELKVTDVQDSSFTLSWAAVEGARYYKINVYQAGEDGEYTLLSGYDGVRLSAADTVKVEGLVPETSYRVELMAGVGRYVSAPATADVTTLELAFAKKIPTGVTITDISDTGFNAAWDAMDDADDYAVTVYSQGYGDETTPNGYDFADRYNGMPELWSATSNIYYSINGFYGEGSPSLCLSLNGDYLEIAYPEALVDSVRFWCRSSAEGNKVRVEVEEDSAWVTVQTLDVFQEATTLTAVVDGAAKVRLVLEREKGYITVDDVYAYCRFLERTPVAGYDRVLTDNRTEYAVTSLTPGQTYDFTVRGVKDGEFSYESPLFTVVLPGSTGITAPVTAADGTEAVYDLQGRRMPEGALPRGIYIVKKSGQPARKVVIR